MRECSVAYHNVVQCTAGQDFLLLWWFHPLEGCQEWGTEVCLWASEGISHWVEKRRKKGEKEWAEVEGKRKIGK